MGGREGSGGRGRESVRVGFLSSVAVEGQGWPRLSDAHHQFFWRRGGKKEIKDFTVEGLKDCCRNIVFSHSHNKKNKKPLTTLHINTKIAFLKVSI